MGQLDNVAVFKVLAAGEDAAKQDRRIDGRDLRVPQSLAGIDVGEVIEESAMRGQGSPKKGEGRQHAQASVLVRDKAALVCNADGGKAKTGGGDAAHHPGVVGARVAAVLDQAGLRIGLLPEIEKTGVLQIVQELLILRREGGRRR